MYCRTPGFPVSLATYSRNSAISRSFLWIRSSIVTRGYLLTLKYITKLPELLRKG